MTAMMNNENHKPKIMKVLVWPDDKLSTPCNEVTLFDETTAVTVQDMFATMVANQGVGLAANQVGIMERIITIRVDQNNPFYLINPEIIESSEEMFKWEEGCLSVPGYFEDRHRPNKIVVRFQDLEGNVKEAEFYELVSFAVQHEMDHLNGKTFVDDISFLKKGRVKKKIKKKLADQIAVAKYAEIHLDEWWDSKNGELKTESYEQQLTGNSPQEDLVKKDEDLI